MKVQSLEAEVDKYQELKNSYEKVINTIKQYNLNTDKAMIGKFLVGISLRMWSCNSFYAKEYGEAINTLTGTEYTMEQIVTAMSCCGEEKRGVLTPIFLKGIDVPAQQKEVINCIGDFLAAIALINGDFTIQEAECWTNIIEKLSQCCLKSEADSFELVFKPKSHITELNKEGYYKTDKEERTTLPVESKNEISGLLELVMEKAVENEDSDEEDEEESVSDNISNLNDKVDAIINAINTASKGTDNMENSTVSTPDDNKTLEELLQELDSLVGLEKVKKDVHSLLNFIKVAKIRKEKGLKVPTISYHLVFTGNPGTGKTTIARLVAQLYYKMGILAKGQLVETDRSALVAGYLGQTAIKTQKVIQEALGGVLFIDEAYSLAGEGEDNYGKEAIETLLKGMEDHRDDLVVIVAGYDELMHKFIDSNPGLRSRFNKYFHFPDYEGDDLLKIFERFCSSNGYCISDEVSAKLLEQFHAMYENRQEHFGNARTVRNIFETAICCQADRIATLPEMSEEDLIVLTESDIQQAVEEELSC